MTDRVRVSAAPGSCLAHPPRLLRLGGERRSEEHRPRASEECAAVYHWVRPLTGAASLGEKMDRRDGE